MDNLKDDKTRVSGFFSGSTKPYTGGMTESLKTLRADIQHKIWQAMVGEDITELKWMLEELDEILNNKIPYSQEHNNGCNCPSRCKV